VLSELDSGIVEFAAKVAADATTVTQDDIDRLRALGLTDRDIFDVVLAAAARSFYTKVLDATGTLADARYKEMDPELRDALIGERPIADGH
jgi:alkylhydroperoxidase family enzyme